MNFIKKIGFIILGLLTTSVGIIGVWVPGLPTTVFILIALWAFSQSSPRLHDWLMRLPVLKTALAEAERFSRDGTIEPRVKFISQACAWTSTLFVAVVTRSVVITVIVGLLALSCSVFMYLTPSSQTSPVDD